MAHQRGDGLRRCGARRAKAKRVPCTRAVRVLSGRMSGRRT